MKYLAILVLLLLTGQETLAQSLQIDSLGFETFVMEEADTSYVMKKYFMAFLKQGPNRTHSDEETALIQQGHMDHIGMLASAGKIDIAGPFGDDGIMRGILIFNVPTIEEVQNLIAQDPAVKAGRLELEVHPWWAAVGSQLK